MFHLPALQNPLLNVLFNNPSLAGMTALVQDLQAHTELTILVPPAGQIAEMVSEDFIRSHILRNMSGITSGSAGRRAHPYVYTNLAGKQVLVKNGHVFSGKGFKESRKVQVVGFERVAAWAEYLPRGSVYGCMKISGPLCGRVVEGGAGPLFPINLPDAAGAGSEEAARGAAAAELPHSATTPTFSDLLQNFPALARSMGPAFYALFHHNNRQFQDLRARKRLSRGQIKALFAAMVAEAFRIVQGSVNPDSPDGDKVYNLLTSVCMKNPGLDMNRLVHEFVELNIYDRLWPSLLFSFSPSSESEHRRNPEIPQSPAFTVEFYRDLSCLSLNQLEVPVDEPWNLNVLYRRVQLAIEVFRELSAPRISNQREKMAILSRTMQVLTEPGPAKHPQPLIDADTLIGLLIMVIVHSKVPDLEASLYYVQNFGLPGAGEPGHVNYMLSNFDAVVFHLRGSLTKEKTASAENYAFWAAVQKADYMQVEALLQLDPRRPLPQSHFLNSKNIHGESFWFLAVRANDAAVFELLSAKTQPFSCIEDLLFDINTSTNQNILMVALQHENPAIIHSIIDVLEFNLEPAEITAFVNCSDHRGRTVGHYLSHDLAALRRLGKYVHWHQRDHGSHTPLFSFCRAYDHPAYKQLIATALQFPQIAYNVHTDKAGNTLLHALSRGIPESEILTSFSTAVDVNELNSRGLSPASLSMRYNRLENMQVLLSDPRFLFTLEDPQSFHNLSDNYSFSAAKKNHTGVSDPEFQQIEELVVSAFFRYFFPKKTELFGVISGKYDSSKKDWQLHTVCRSNGVIAHVISLNTLRKIIQVFWMSNVYSFMPMEKLWANFPETKPNNPINAKYSFNRLLEHVNMFLSSLSFLDGAQSLFSDLVHRTSEESIFEMSKSVARAKPPKGSLDPQKVREMYHFVNFSKTGLVSYGHVTRRLANLASCAAIKSADVQDAHDALLRALQVAAAGGCVLSPLGTLRSFVAWLASCTQQLVSQCDLLFGQIHLWESLYEQIQGFNKEMTEMEAVILKRVPEDRKKSIFSVDAVPADDSFKEEGEFTSLFGLADSRKAKYKRLAAQKADHVTKINDLTANLRSNHEAAAAEMSQFLRYRAEFVALGLRRLARESVAALSHRSTQLEKCLERVRVGARAERARSA